MHNPKIIKIDEPFSVIGLQVKTNNIDEFSADKCQIPGLWQNFTKSSLVNHSNLNDPYVYGVYSCYENDHQGEYIVTAGINSQSILSKDDEFDEVVIQAGHYLVFEATGKIPQSIVSMWKYIWQYFSKNLHPKRKYTTDFEKYISDNKVEIYIAVED